jgi:serine/threonine protein kinase
MSEGNLCGQTLSGRYQIQSLIGQGGMAAVYKAYDPNLRRSVGIKVIHPHLSENAEFTRRFEEEAAAVAHLRHPNIVQVFDFNHDGNLYYMVMEFLAGETLQSRLKRLNSSKRLLPVKDAIKFSAELCDASDYAHQRGMIHRDIKPANVMLDVNGKAILMDFGIARIVGAVEHTATGAVLGTAMYMAPEQIQGLHADARADIYSLGVTLFEMLSGRPPYEADSAMTLMMMHLNDPVPDVRDLQPDAPPEIVTLIDKAMAKNRGARFQSAADMGAALRAIQGEPASTPVPVSPAGQPGSVEATLIETPIVLAANATMIESAQEISAGGQAVRQTGPAGRNTQSMPLSGQTFVEQPARTAPPAQVQAAAFPTTPDQSSFPVRQKRRKALPFILLAFVIILGVGGYFGYQQFFKKGSLPLEGAAVSTVAGQVVALIPTQTSPVQAGDPTQSNLESELVLTITALAPAQVVQTSTPEAADVLTLAPTPSPVPTEIVTPTPAPVIIGGADKIAYLNGNNIWMANLDGSDLVQLSADGTSKTALRWLPDGQGLSYISGKCIHTVTLDGQDTVITCFNNSKYLTAFEVSPDGTQVAISLDNQLYLLPFDLDGLKKANSHADLASLATCADLAPYKRNFAYAVRWSKDNNQWAALVLGVLKDGRRGDLVQVFSVSRCIPNPLVVVQFPQPHFSYNSYDKNPTIQDITWDGGSLFAFHDNKRNDGFGDLHIFNMETFQPNLSINPVKNACCYRDPQWSPDGSYLVFAFQNIGEGSKSITRLYYVPYGSIGTGENYEPLPLPEITDPEERPQPVLRPALAP